MPSNYNLDEEKLYYIQMFLSFCLIVSILISISLSYNEVLKLKGCKFYNKKDETNILLFNRSFNTLIVVGYLFINIIERNNNKNYSSKDIFHSNLQLSAGTFNLIASLIVLFVAFDSINDITAEDITNPEL